MFVFLVCLLLPSTQNGAHVKYNRREMSSLHSPNDILIIGGVMSTCFEDMRSPIVFLTGYG